MCSQIINIALLSQLILLLLSHSLSNWEHKDFFSSPQSYIIHKTYYECLSLFWQQIYCAQVVFFYFYFSATLCYTLLLVNHLTPMRRHEGQG